MDLFDLARDVVAELEREEEARFTEEARRFLRDLVPDSQEGMWFDAIAGSYPSRLAAAIAYVKTVTAA